MDLLLVIDPWDCEAIVGCSATAYLCIDGVEMLWLLMDGPRHGSVLVGLRRLHAGAQRRMPHDAECQRREQLWKVERCGHVVSSAGCVFAGAVRASLATHSDEKISNPGVSGIEFRGRIRRVTTPNLL